MIGSAVLASWGWQDLREAGVSKFEGQVDSQFDGQKEKEEQAEQQEQEKQQEQKERRSFAVEGIVERREHTRYAVDAWAEVMVKDGTMLFRGQVLDVSQGGCYIETEARLRLAPGTPVEIVFRAHDRVLRCEGTSRMVRTRGAGFLFETMSAKVRVELEGLIAELSGERG
nr:PilZ domain-containing protein [Edaphobacter lichenicola]